MITPIKYTTKAYSSTIDGVDREDLSDYVTGGGLDINLDRQIKTNGDVTFVNMPESLLNPLSDFVHIYTRMEGADGDVAEESRGVFTVDLPEADLEPYGQAVKGKLYDKSILLADQSFDDVYNIPVGEFYTESMKHILSLAGIDGESIADNSTKVTGEAITYWPDANLLSAFNELAGAIGHYSLTMDRFGNPESSPFINIDSTQPSLIVVEDDFINDVIVTPFSPVLANRVVVYFNSPDAAPLTAERNLPDEHPLSAANRNGRVITKWQQLNQAVSQAVVDATADQLYTGILSEYTVLQISLLPEPTLPTRANIDLYLETQDRVYSGRFYVRTQKNGFTHKTGKLDLEIYRTLDYSSINT